MAANDFIADGSDDNIFDEPTVEEENSCLMVATALSHISIFAFAGYITFLCLRSPVQLFHGHPFCETLGFAVLNSIAIATYSNNDMLCRRQLYNSKLTVHWVMELISAMIIVGGFGIIVTVKIIENEDHFVSPHSIVGLVFVLFTSVTFISGFFKRSYKFCFGKCCHPRQIKSLHPLLGITTYLLGVMTVILGLFSFVENEIARYLCLVLLLYNTICTLLRPTMIYILRKNTHTVSTSG